MEAFPTESASPKLSQQAGPALEPDFAANFRTSMRRHASGVCIVTVGAGENVNGMAVTAASSFSMDPPSILVCINGSASLAQHLEEGVDFGLTVLGVQHQALAAAFSRKPSGRTRFDHGRWRLETGKTPWLEDAPANLVCIVDRRLAYGTHLALIGRVQDARLGPDAPSLVYRDGRYS